MVYTSLYLATTTKKHLNQLTGNCYPDVQPWFRQRIFRAGIKENRQPGRETEPGGWRAIRRNLKQANSAMAPWIKLSIAKPLPTISEAVEDILEDKTSSSKGNVCMSPDSCTGEDYLQSICQLARPAFSLSLESKWKVQDTEKRAMLHSGHQISNLPETPQIIVPKYKLTDPLPNLMSSERNGFVLDCSQTYSSSRADPLEELYTESQKTRQWRCSDGSENTSISSLQHSCHGASLATPPEKTRTEQGAVGFPRLPSPRPIQRESSCPDLKSLKIQGRMPPLQGTSSQKEKDPLSIHGKPIWLYTPRENALGAKMLRSSPRGQQPLNVVAPPERERLKSCIYTKRDVSGKEGCLGQFSFDPKATSRHWISEYQCAWKEAKVRASLLPAIAES
ncbi:hypothetical protein lerEdw1_016202 [Lerista edwardsae]|nr:hypothetical protein lerEdw1_016202 [Lerista edwardsae]